MNYDSYPRYNFVCLDLKSFYASVEAVDHGLDPMNDFVVVVGDKSRSGSVVLASSPKMKKVFGIKTGSRLFEIPNDKRIHIFQARMEFYLIKSMEITKILHNYGPPESIFVYSIDEIFYQHDGGEVLFGDRVEAAKKIQRDIYDQHKLISCAGCGDNRFISKVTLDNFAKQTYIDNCIYEEVPVKLHPLPIGDIWGIGTRMKRNLEKMGIRKLGDIAHYPLERLKKKWGVMGEQLYWHSWGIDLTPPFVTPNFDSSSQKGIGSGKTLLKDHDSMVDIQRVILAQCEEVCRRARESKLAGRTIHLGIGYSQEFGGGFSRSQSISIPTNVTMDVYKVCLSILRKHYQGFPVRKVHVSLHNVVSDVEVQLNLFEDTTKKAFTWLCYGYLARKVW